MVGAAADDRHARRRSGREETAASSALAERVSAALKQGRTVHFLAPYRAEHAVKLAALINVAPGAVKDKRSVVLHHAVAAQRLTRHPKK